MDAEEARKLAQRIDRFETAQRRAFQLGKADTMLDAMVEGKEHDVASIVINLRDKDIRYTDHKGTIYKICSLAGENQAEMVDNFVKYASGVIKAKIKEAEKDMEEA